MKLIAFELRKIWRAPSFILCLCVLLFANYFLLWGNTQFENEDIPSASYTKVGKQLSYLEETEKENWLREQSDICMSLMRIEDILENAASSGEDPRIGNEKLFDTYGDLYSRRIYPYYTHSLSEEYYLFSMLRTECEMVHGYENFLNDIRNKAKELSSISIFNTPESGFEQKNIANVASAYDRIDPSKVEICYYPQKGIFTALSYQYTDVLLLFAMLLVASISIRSEKDKGLLSLIRATANGRSRTATAKIVAMGISLILILTGLYGINLLYCNAVYGIGPLSRSIQSIPFLMRGTSQITLRVYLILFMLAKWAASFVIGVWVLLMGLICRNAFSSWLFALGLPVAETIVRIAVSPTGHMNVLRYANLISLMQTNEFLGTYRNLYWFGIPIPITLVEVITAVLFLSVFLAIFILVFALGNIRTAVNSKSGIQCLARFNLIKSKKKTTVFREERRKMYHMQGAAILLLMFAVLCSIQGARSESYLNISESYYQFYMSHLSGPFDIDRYQWLAKEDEKLQPLYELKKELMNGNISQDEYAARVGISYDLSVRMQTQNKIISGNFKWIKEHDGAQLVYEPAYEKLFDFEETTDKQQTLLASLMCVLCCASVFSFERQGGMDRILKTTPLGREATVRSKIINASVCCGVIAVLSVMPLYWQVKRDYGIYACSAPAFSLKQFESVPRIFTLSDLMMCGLLMKILACMCVGMLTLVLSQKLGNTMLTILSSCLIFCMPMLLSMSGMLHVKWMGVYPLYHWVALFVQKSGAVLWFWVIAAVILIAACIQELFQCYREEA